MYKYHLEILKVSRQSENSAHVKIYIFNDKSIRECLNLPIVEFYTGANMIVDLKAEGIKMKFIKEHKQLIIDGFGNGQVILPLESARSTSFIAGDRTNLNGHIILKGECQWMAIVDNHNRKYRDTIN